MGKIYKLGEICEIRSGKTPSTKIKEYWDNGTIPWLTQTEITAQTLTSKKFITKNAVKECGLSLTTKNSVLLCNISEAIAFFVGIPFLSCNQQIFLLEPNISKIEPNYLYYLLCAEKNKLNFFMRGTIFRSLTKTELENFSVFLPSLQEQHQILQKFQIVYNKLFQSEVIYRDFLLSLMKKYLELGDLLFLKYKDSQIKIKDHFKLVRGKTPPTKNPEYYENGTIKWINSGVLTNLYFLTDKTKPSKLVTEKAAQECQLFYAKPHTVLFSDIDLNPEKIVWVMKNSTEGTHVWTLLGTHVWTLLGTDVYTNATLFFALRQIDFSTYASGSIINHLQGSVLLNMKINWVSDPIKQKLFFTILDSKLAKIKDLLLLKYFGKK